MEATIDCVEHLDLLMSSYPSITRCLRRMHDRPIQIVSILDMLDKQKSASIVPSVETS